MQYEPIYTGQSVCYARKSKMAINNHQAHSLGLCHYWGHGVIKHYLVGQSVIFNRKNYTHQLKKAWKGIFLWRAFCAVWRHNSSTPESNSTSVIRVQLKYKIIEILLHLVTLDTTFIKTCIYSRAFFVSPCSSPEQCSIPRALREMSKASRGHLPPDRLRSPCQQALVAACQLFAPGSPGAHSLSPSDWRGSGLVLPRRLEQVSSL